MKMFTLLAISYMFEARFLALDAMKNTFSKTDVNNELKFVLSIITPYIVKLNVQLIRDGYITFESCMAS